MALGTGGAAHPVSRYERYRSARNQMRNFQKIVRALGDGFDPETAMLRAVKMLDALRDDERGGEVSDADIYLQVLAEMVDEQGDNEL